MKRSLALAAAALAAVTLVAAGCGGADEVPADAVAVVDGTPITRSSLDGLLTRAKKSYAAQKRDFPKAGTSDYQSLQTQAVAYLVQREEYAREADKLGIDVTDQQIAKKVDEVKKQYFGDSQAKFDKGLADQGYTKATLEDDIRSQLLTEGIYKKVTTDAKVTDADVKSYYEKNRANYTVPESRSVRHILVKSKADADRIRTELVNGGDFAALAKANSIDPGSKDAGGKLTVSKGQTVAPFDKAAFSLDTNELSQPVKTQFGYHLIQPLAAVKAGSVTPFAQVKDQIKTQLESETKNTAVNKWVSDVEKEYKDKVQYAAGFEPPDTSTTTGETTTTSG
ncbi:MAG: peptidyl-prolyl cis-trans isomerase [Gaiella sp.]|jgi:parvulin-like peptidyl-prolyl isomerase|uniref:peptidyl-prolyl cis-trans isomerase n=1 Tax=Gaiella sp. TaxID=2663207 RepID=UPI003C6680A4